MTLEQLDTARGILNLSRLAEMAGRERTYYHQALAGRRGLTPGDEAALDAALARYGLAPTATGGGGAVGTERHRGNGEERGAQEDEEE